MPDLDQLLRPDIGLAAGQAAQPFDYTVIEHRAAQRRRNRTVLAFSAAAAAVAVALVGSVQIASRNESAPTIPIQQPTPTPTPGWTGPLHPAAESMPKVSPTSLGALGVRWRDGGDADAAGIDILDLEAGGWRRLEWRLALRGAPHDGVPGDPQDRAVEYGLVVDSDGDRVADCEIGINDNAQGPQGYRTWVKNLRTGVTREQDGPPYGYPFDFTSPEAPADRTMSLYFLQTVPWKTTPGAFPCAPFKRAAAFYAWALLTEKGTPVAWDFAPDAAWLRMPAQEAQ
jgi:hypothetical protein